MDQLHLLPAESDCDRFEKAGYRRTVLIAGIIALLTSIGYFIIALSEDISISTRERLQLIEMTNSFVSVFSENRGDNSPVPAKFRRLGIDHFSDIAQNGQGQNETMVRMPGRPGSEIEAREMDPRLVEIIQRYVNDPSLQPLQEHRFENNRFVGRTVYPSMATSESCVTCHNAALESEVYEVGDVMGAFIVERDLTGTLIDDIKYAGLIFGSSFVLFGLAVLRERKRGLKVMRLESQVRVEEMKNAAEAKEKFLLSHDPLTGLPNRKLFNDYMQDAFAHGQQESLAVALIDLDDFKAINDSAGHAAGDAMLNHVAARLKLCLNQREGLAARLGGDEFALVWQITPSENAGDMGPAILSALAESLEFENLRFMPRCSIGIADWSVVQANSPTDLLKASDDALYAAKHKGKNTYQMYDLSIHAVSVRRNAIASHLPQAIRDGKLRVVMQPKVWLDTGQFVGFEALARWNHNGQELVPDEFIPIAENTGAVRDIDLLMLEEAALFSVATERQTGLAVPVSVNLSAISFCGGSLVRDVEAILARTQLNPQRLTIEITESVAIENWTIVEDVLNRLRRHGIRTALDDFGTGYSSLGYLLRMKFEEIKIDKAFIDDIEHSKGNRVILDHIANMAEDLGSDLIIEGIETERQIELISGGKRRIAQGYFFSPPLELEDAHNYVVATAFPSAPIVQRIVGLHLDGEAKSA